jgi:hypothetical protein
MTGDDMSEPATEPTYDDLAMLVRELDAAPYSVIALRGKNAGMAELNLRIPADTVRRLWALAKALKEQAETT